VCECFGVLHVCCSVCCSVLQCANQKRVKRQSESVRERECRDRQRERESARAESVCVRECVCKERKRERESDRERV